MNNKPGISLEFKTWPYRKRIAFVWGIIKSAIFKQTVNLLVPETRMNIPFSNNSVMLAEFISFCLENPKLRFWQAVSAWTGCRVFASHSLSKTGKIVDTYYWRGKHDDIITN